MNRRGAIYAACLIGLMLGTASASDNTCPGDVDLTGRIDSGDLSVVLINFGIRNAEYQDGDITLDGQVDLGDLIYVLTYFGVECDPPLPCPGDMNRNHRIDVSDLATLLGNFGLRPARAQDGDVDGDYDVDLTDLVILSAMLNSECEIPLEGCVASNATWQSQSLPEQTELFALSFDAVPRGDGIDGLTVLSASPVTQYSDMAAAVRFNTDGLIDMRDAGTYRADVALPYTADTVYSFRIVVDVPNSQYTVFVTTPANGEVLLGQNMRFRNEQTGVGVLRYLSVQAGIGGHDTCNIGLLSSENLAPTVDAGPDQEASETTIQLGGSAFDDGRPDGVLTTAWTQVSGPVAATFADAAAADTQVTLPAEGTYVLRLTASDGALSASDDVSIVRIPPPPPRLEVSPGNLTFGVSQDDAAFQVGMSGIGTLDYAIDADVAWLQVAPDVGDTSGETDTIVATVDRAGLADGSHHATISVTDNTGVTETISVTVLVGQAGPMSTATRAVGLAPLAVFFDATLEGSGVMQPPLVNGRRAYADLHYQWDFGDDPTATWSVTGLPKNAATGYCAAHVYEQPGTYQAALLVIDPVSGESQVYSQTIEVLPFSGTTYYVSSSGSNGNDGLAPDRPLQTIGQALSLSGPNTRILLKRGDTWNVPGGLTIDRAGPGLIGAYAHGDGSDDPTQPKPRIVVSGAGEHGVEFRGWSVDVSDWRLMDLELIGPGGSGAGDGIRGNGTLRGATLLRLDIRNFYVGLLWSVWSVAHADNTAADCVLEDMFHNDVYAGGARHAFLGNRMEPPTNEHVLRVWYMDRGVYSNNLLGAAPRHQVKLHNSINAGTPSDTRYNVFTDNTFVGSSAWSVTIGPQDEFSNEVITDTLLERNIFRSTGNGVQSACRLWARYTTVRNNLFFADASAPWYECVSISQRAGEGPPVGNRILNNTAYRQQSSEVFRFCRIAGSAVDTQVRNNLVSPGPAGQRILIDDASGIVQASHNLVSDNPGYVDAAGGNLRLQEGSPAIDMGLDVGLLFDFDLNGRFDDVTADTGAGAITYYDVGAFEYQGKGRP